nr:MMPL family transporter [Bacillus alkalicellulosilyticus]
MRINIPAHIVRHKKAIVIFFFLITIICTIAQFFVSVNYNMTDYLPDEAQSTLAIDIMEEEFGGSVPNTRIMIHDVSIQEALMYKNNLSLIDGVTDVIWLDDVVDLKTPLEMIDNKLVETYYKNDKALFSIGIREGEEVAVTNEIYALIGDDNAMAGEAVDTATQQSMAVTETLYAAALLVPIIIIILVVSTTSWVEPVFFLTAIGVSILINLGTNIFIGEVSFVTQSVSPVLQLAVSLDYAIFLLHSFSSYRKKMGSPEEAMQMAIKKSFPAIGASAATTFFGFLALTLMNFEIGADLGLNLVKGIVFSFISIMIFLPALTLCFFKWIDKTQHKSFVPDFTKVGDFVMKVRFPTLIIVLLLIVPSFLAQNNTSFTYGIGEQPETTRSGSDLLAIEEAFGKSTPVVLLVPRGDIVKEMELAQDLKELPQVTSIVSYVSSVSSVIPPEYLDESILSEFYSDHYTRMILYTNTDKEGDTAFSLVETIQEMTASYYDSDAYSLGESVTLYEMKRVVERDNVVVNTMTVVAIALVLFFTFKSISIPIILLLTIQTAVWVNLSIPYFTDVSLVFVGYLIVSTVQLAATVDYGILLTEAYMKKRKEMTAIQAFKQTLHEKTFAITISAAILSSVGFILWLTSTNPIVSSIGLLLGRGAMLAFIMVVLFLPAMLLVFDKVVSKTTFKSNYYKERNDDE